MLLGNENRPLSRPFGPEEDLSIRRLEKEVDLDNRTKHDVGGVLRDPSGPASSSWEER
jgi:hypothetical protein